MKDTEDEEKPEPNTNCLAGMACPKCKVTEPFNIVVTTMVTAWDDRTEPPGHGGDQKWMDESYCECLECGVGATVADFYTKNQTKKAK